MGPSLGPDPPGAEPRTPAATCPCRLPPASAPQSATAWLRRPGLTPTLQLRPQEGSGEPRCPREAGPSHPRPRVLDPQPGRLLTWREGSRKLGGTGGRTTTCAKGGPRPQAATSHAHPGLQGRRPDSCPHGPGASAPPTTRTPRAGAGSATSLLRQGPRPAGRWAGRTLTVRPDQGLDALAAPLAQPVDHEEQQREDEEGRHAADDEAHPTGHGVQQAAAVCGREGSAQGFRAPDPPAPRDCSLASAPPHLSIITGLSRTLLAAGPSREECPGRGAEVSRPSLGLATELCPPCTTVLTEAGLTRSPQVIRGSGCAPRTPESQFPAPTSPCPASGSSDS